MTRKYSWNYVDIRIPRRYIRYEFLSTTKQADTLSIIFPQAPFEWNAKTIPPQNLHFKEAIEQISDAYSVNKNLSKTAQTNVLEILRLHVVVHRKWTKGNHAWKINTDSVIVCFVREFKSSVLKTRVDGKEEIK